MFLHFFARFIFFSIINDILKRIFYNPFWMNVKVDDFLVFVFNLASMLNSLIKIKKRCL